MSDTERLLKTIDIAQHTGFYAGLTAAFDYIQEHRDEPIERILLGITELGLPKVEHGGNTAIFHIKKTA